MIVSSVRKADREKPFFRQKSRVGDSFAKSIRIVFSLSSVEERKKKFSKSLSNKPKNEGHLMQQVELNWIPVGNYHSGLVTSIQWKLK